MTSEYQAIYSSFLSKITDYKFLSLPEDDIYDLMRGWLHSTAGKVYIRRIFDTLVLDDEVLKITFELKNPVDDNADLDYVVEILAKGMVIEWLEPQVKSVLNTSQMFGGKEQKFYAQANHLSELKGMLSDAKTELRKMIRDHGYIYNSYIGGETL